MYLADRINTGGHDKELMISPLSGAPLHTTDANGNDIQTSHTLDRPLVCQIAGNNIEALIQAGKRVQGVVDAVDLNYGCPQRCAEDAGIGAFFLERNPDLACEVVSRLSQSLNIPVLVKMRLHADGEEATVKLARRLQTSGASAVTLHARHRWQREHEGPADWSIIRAVKQHLDIPVFANGSVQCLADGIACIAYTGVDAVMSGTGLLRHPSMFADSTLISPSLLSATAAATYSSRSRDGEENEAHSSCPFTSKRAAYRALRNCYRYLDIVDEQLFLDAHSCSSGGGSSHSSVLPVAANDDTAAATTAAMNRCGSVAVNGREAHEVIRDHLMAMLQVHVMGAISCPSNLEFKLTSFAAEVTSDS
jgi:tRNA-dihydrouridine synthase